LQITEIAVIHLAVMAVTPSAQRHGASLSLACHMAGASFAASWSKPFHNLVPVAPAKAYGSLLFVQQWRMPALVWL
jgi:hypothetical protein